MIAAVRLAHNVGRELSEFASWSLLCAHVILSWKSQIHVIELCLVADCLFTIQQADTTQQPKPIATQSQQATP
jgi:hypothetical protein